MFPNTMLQTRRLYKLPNDITLCYKRFFWGSPCKGPKHYVADPHYVAYLDYVAFLDWNSNKENMFLPFPKKDRRAQLKGRER